MAFHRTAQNCILGRITESQWSIHRIVVGLPARKLIIGHSTVHCTVLVASSRLQLKLPMGQKKCRLWDKRSVGVKLMPTCRAAARILYQGDLKSDGREHIYGSMHSKLNNNSNNDNGFKVRFGLCIRHRVPPAYTTIFFVR